MFHVRNMCQHWGLIFWIYVGKYIPYMEHMEHMGKMYSPRSGPGQFLRFMTDRFKGTRVRVLKEELRNCRNEKRRLPHLFYDILFILIPKKEGTPLTHYPLSFWKAFGFPSFVKHVISLRQIIELWLGEFPAIAEATSTGSHCFSSFCNRRGQKNPTFQDFKARVMS